MAEEESLETEKAMSSVEPEVKEVDDVQVEAKVEVEVEVFEEEEAPAESEDKHVSCDSGEEQLAAGDAVEQATSTPNDGATASQTDVENLGYEPAEPAPPHPSRKPRRCSELVESSTDIHELLDYDNTMEVEVEASPTAERTRPGMGNRQCSELMEVGIEAPALNQGRRSSIVVDPYEISYRPTVFSFYKPPRQRQRWGQKQILPRVNWGDLFFDLFYVAAAYNTSNILVETPSGLGLLYALGTFFSVQQIWALKMGYDARFVVEDDLCHRFFEIAALAALASAVVHIRPVEMLSDPSHHLAMFGFSLSMVVVQVLQILRYVELYFAGKGERQVLKTSSKREGGMLAMLLVLQIAATVIAGMAYFGDDHDDRIRRLAEVAATTTTNSTTGDEEETSNYEAATETSVTNVPIWLSLLVPVSYWAILTFRVIFLFPNDGSHKKMIVPMNVDFSIHRTAEWTMLMLGESILSLLIVDVPEENSQYYSTFYCSLLTVVLLQYLHFRSQPHSADDHVLRRSKNRGMISNDLWFPYSASLIGLGAAFTLFVLSFSWTEEGDANDHRRLAGGGATLYPVDEMKQRAAHMFSISLSMIFFMLDAISFLHLGFEHSKKRCYCKKNNKYNFKGVFLVTIRFGILAFVATLSQWITDPEVLAGAGLGLTLFQVILRKLGEKYMNEGMEHLDETEESEASLPDDGMPTIPE